MKRLISAAMVLLCILSTGVFGVYANATDNNGEGAAPELKMGMIAAGASRSIWVRENGTVATVGGVGGITNEWKDVIQVAAYNHVVGLKKDGTLVATGDNKQGQCDVHKLVRK